MIRPLQRDADYLVLALWRARIWLNQQRRQRQQPTDRYEIPPLLRETLKRA
jgi:hypothetical protein